VAFATPEAGRHASSRARQFCLEPQEKYVMAPFTALDAMKGAITYFL